MVLELVGMLLKIPAGKCQEVLRKHGKDFHTPARKNLRVAENCKLLRYARHFRCSEFNFHAIGGKDRLARC